MIETTESMKQISGELAVLPYQSLRDEEKLKVDMMKSTLKKIEADKSKGAHNIELIQQTLSDYKEFLQQLPK